jgi:hypothetical protein
LQNRVVDVQLTVDAQKNMYEIANKSISSLKEDLSEKNAHVSIMGKYATMLRSALGSAPAHILNVITGMKGLEKESAGE